MDKIIDLDIDTNLPSNIAGFYAMLSDMRNRLLEEVDGITQKQLDFSPSITKIETIGTLLFHIAAIEFSWIYEDIFKEEMVYEEWKYAFALREQLDPPQMTNKSLSFYLEKLHSLRERVYATVRGWNDKELEKVVKSGNQFYTIRWILYHLVQHESHHIGQINLLKRMYKIH